MARRVKDKAALENAVDDLVEEGWSLSEKTSDKAVLKKNSYGSLGAHIIIGLLTAWWTLGFVNLLYLAKRFWLNSRKRVIRVE